MSTVSASLVLRPGRERSVARRHPWIFSGAVERLNGEAPPGSTVDVLSSTGQFLGRAAYSPASQIRARMWTFKDEPVDVGFFRRTLQGALDLRTQLGLHLPAAPATPTPRALRVPANAFRLVFAEADRIPGLIADLYAETVVMQCLTAGADYWRDTFADLLMETTGASYLVEKSDADVRSLEALPPRVVVPPDDPSPTTVIEEYGLKFKVELQSGQKTGFYLDQRDNHVRLRTLARDRDVLDCFCYTGGFTLNALAGEARSVLAVDSSGRALSLASENVRLNDVAASRAEFREADVFEFLRRMRDEARRFDLIVLDPPRLAPTAGHAEKAARAYKDLNLLAFKLLNPRGILMTYSCSGGIDGLLFQKIVASAALDAGVEARIVERLSQAADHPVALQFPEAAYLKGLICVRS